MIFITFKFETLLVFRGLLFPSLLLWSPMPACSLGKNIFSFNSGIRGMTCFLLPKAFYKNLKFWLEHVDDFKGYPINVPLSCTGQKNNSDQHSNRSPQLAFISPTCPV